MFESDSDLEKSQVYFELLQILRTMDEWIYGSLEDLVRIRKDWKSKISVRFLQSFNAKKPMRQWYKRIEIYYCLIMMKHLWDRLERRTEDIKSLRDGVSHERLTRANNSSWPMLLQLFNATAVLEAIMSRQMNQAVLIFTLATVFYLPLGFVAVGSLATN